MSEAGFEVAAAYVRVSPDVADFPALLDEALGGLQIAVSIIPDPASLANFAGAIDDGIGSLTTTVDVGADTSSAEASVEDLLSDISGSRGDLVVGADTDTALGQVQGLSDEVSGLGGNFDITAGTGAASEGIGALADELAEVDSAAGTAQSALSAVGGDLGTLQADADSAAASIGHVATELGALGSEHAAGLAAAGLGTIPVTVVPDVADFAQRLDEEVGGTVVPVTVVPDVADFAQAVDEAVGDEGVVIPVTADTSSAVADIEEVGAAAASADGGIDTLYNGILSIGPAASESEMQAVDAMGSFRDAAATTAGEFGEIGAAAESAGAQAAQALAGAGEAAAGADSGIETFLGGIYALGPAADEAGSAVQDAMGNARQGIADLATAAGSVDYGPLTEGLNSADGAVTGLAADAPAAADAAGGLSGVLEELAGRMSYFAVDPFMWMYGAPVVIEGVSAAISALSNNTMGLVTAFATADNATGYNVSGYKELSGQLAVTEQSLKSVSSSVTENADANGRFAASISPVAVAINAVSGAQQQAATEAADLGGHLSVLQGMYGLSAQQAAQLAQAAGVSASQLEGGGAAADAAMAKIIAYADANSSAAGQVTQLDNDMMTFANDTLTVQSRISALDNAYSTLTGNLVASQQAQLAVTNDFLGIQTAASQTGASMNGTNAASIALQQAFYTTAGAIEQTANAMLQQGDTTAQVTAYVDEQTNALSRYAGGNQQAQQAVQGLQQWEDKMRSSLDAADASILTSAGDLQNHFITQLEDAGVKSSATKADVDALTDSIIATGSQSAATQADRAQLIKDLTNAGLSAQAATKLVDQFIKSIQNIPSSKTISIVETATGTITINEATQTATTQGPGGNANFHGAGGGLVYGGSGNPRADDIHAMLSHGEYVVQAPAVSRYGTGMLDDINSMHFADGGYAGDLSGLSAFTGMQYAGLQSALTSQVEAILEAAVASGKQGGTSGGGAPIIINFNGTQWPTAEQQQALMHQLSAAVGVS